MGKAPGIPDLEWVKKLGEKPSPAQLELMLSLLPAWWGWNRRHKQICVLSHKSILCELFAKGTSKLHPWSPSPGLHWMFPGAVTLCWTTQTFSIRMIFQDFKIYSGRSVREWVFSHSDKSSCLFFPNWQQVVQKYLSSHWSALLDKASCQDTWWVVMWFLLVCASTWQTASLKLSHLYPSFLSPVPDSHLTCLSLVLHSPCLVPNFSISVTAPFLPVSLCPGEQTPNVLLWGVFSNCSTRSPWASQATLCVLLWAAFCGSGDCFWCLGVAI